MQGPPVLVVWQVVGPGRGGRKERSEGRSNVIHSCVRTKTNKGCPLLGLRATCAGVAEWADCQPLRHLVPFAFAAPHRKNEQPSLKKRPKMVSFASLRVVKMTRNDRGNERLSFCLRRPAPSLIAISPRRLWAPFLPLPSLRFLPSSCPPPAHHAFRAACQRSESKISNPQQPHWPMTTRRP